ncbi:MAG TPA: hypothetical protein VG942_17125 [Hyphomonadaceae bacterium]|nr:hypothetical protein [Hyphomonadaceae bacterium]
MDRRLYPKDAVDVLYMGLRHKIAHLGHPYFIFDTATKKDTIDASTKRPIFQAPYKRYGWAVYAAVRPQPLELVDFSTPQVPKNYAPWSLTYDAAVKISVRSLSKDLVASVLKPTGYLANLKSDSSLLAEFMKCMNDFYPR